MKKSGLVIFTVAIVYLPVSNFFSVVNSTEWTEN